MAISYASIRGGELLKEAYSISFPPSQGFSSLRERLVGKLRGVQTQHPSTGNLGLPKPILEQYIQDMRQMVVLLNKHPTVGMV